MSISDRMKRTDNCVAFSLDNKTLFSGELYNCYQDEGVRFSDVQDFFNIMNAFLDAVEYPAQKVKYRSFKKTLPTIKIVDINPSEKLFNIEQILEKCQKNAFVIMVTGRDNATWQGKVYKKSNDKEYSFNSEVELLKILK